MVIFIIKSQIKSPYFNVILKISKSSQNDLKSDFVKSSIKSLNTLAFTCYRGSTCGGQMTPLETREFPESCFYRCIQGEKLYAPAFKRSAAGEQR
jgi:hypothetical protein